MHFLVHPYTIVPGLVLVSNLGCDSTLVECTRGQTTLSIMQAVNHHCLATVQVSLLLRNWLSCNLLCSFLELTLRSLVSRAIGWQELVANAMMLLIMNLFNRILGRFDQVAVARIVRGQTHLLTSLVEQFLIDSIDA